MKWYEYGWVKSRKGDIGIEIEVEGKEPMPTIDSDWWKCKTENSLRFYGMEYYTTRPLLVGQELSDAIDFMCKQINSKKLIENTNRTSIHTHHNMTKMTALEILNCICAFWIVENVLANYCGEDREMNLFCLRLKDAEAVIDEVITSLDSNPVFSTLGNTVRYAGLNTCALNTFGSLEIRLKQGTTSPTEIHEWAYNMYNLFNVASFQFNNPEQLFEYYVNHTSKQFLELLFGGFFAEKLMTQVPSYKSLMEESATLVVELAYAKDWPQWHQGIITAAKEGKVPKPKMKNTISYEDLAYNPPASNTNTISWSIPNG